MHGDLALDAIRAVIALRKDDMPPDNRYTTGDGDAARWQDELVALLADIEGAHTPEVETRVLGRLVRLDPDLQRFLVERMGEQDTPEAAAFLSALAAHPEAPSALREHAGAGVIALAERGIAAPVPGIETFHAGWVQRGRERGEQIMMLGWRLPDGRLEGLVFLLDWRGDGLKDFYRTREISDVEWGELIEHNGKKGATLTAISLAEGRALLEEALAEGQRFSRPVPREYRLAQRLVEQRILRAAELPATPRQYVAPDLEPAAVVTAYLQALHYRDYLLVWELLAPEHPMRAIGRGPGVDTLRRQQKHAPRRRLDASMAPEQPVSAGDKERVTMLAESEEESVDRSGRRVRQPVRERYHLRSTPDGWRIVAVHLL
jgi:hypothetical protein